MKSVYIAGSFYKKDNSLKDDFRTELLGDEKYLWNECDITIKVLNNTMKYVGPFFYYPEKEKKLKHLNEQEIVVLLEKTAIENCDVFIGYFGNKSSPGTVAELLHAVSMKKDIYIFYLKYDNNRIIKSKYWFGILLAKEIAKNNNTNIFIKEVSNAREFLNCIK